MVSCVPMSLGTVPVLKSQSGKNKNSWGFWYSKKNVKRIISPRICQRTSPDLSHISKKQDLKNQIVSKQLNHTLKCHSKIFTEVQISSSQQGKIHNI